MMDRERRMKAESTPCHLFVSFIYIILSTLCCSTQGIPASVVSLNRNDLIELLVTELHTQALMGWRISLKNCYR